MLEDCMTQLSDQERDAKIDEMKNVLHPLEATEAEMLALVLGFQVCAECCKMRGFTAEGYHTHVTEAFERYLEGNPYEGIGVKH
jgi:sulfur relay (sulfurtransferase) complex TusBCD TusD component (DsrE family)